MKELRAILNEYDGDRMLVGEDDNVNYLGSGEDELQMVFNFPLMRTERITPSHIRINQEDRLAQLRALSIEGWPCNTLGNHDSPRIHTRYGDRQHDAELARLHAALVLTLKGTPFLYNGEEIGMTDYIITDPTQLRDTMATWYYDRLVNELNVPAEEAALRAGQMSRDKNRTPMQWSNQPNAGFSPSEVKTWLPVNPDYKRGINVRDQEHNPSSLLNYYRLLLKVRRQNPALIEGEYLPVHTGSDEYFAFLRQSDEQTALVVLNFSGRSLELDFTDVEEIRGQNLRILFSSAQRLLTNKPPRGLVVSPYEVLISEVQPADRSTRAGALA
jgi:alpha-glucosidase